MASTRKSYTHAAKRVRTETSSRENFCSSEANSTDNAELNVESFLANSWENLSNGRVASEFLNTEVSNHVECSTTGRQCYRNGVPERIRKNPGSIFPFGQKIMLPEVPSCVYCKARKFFLEPDGFCCCNGDIVLRPVVLPPEMVQLLTGSTEICKHFRTYIRVYNGNFAYTSMGVKYDTSLASKRECGIYTFRVNGQIHHYLNDLKPSGSPPIGLQLYFYDPENELQHRLAATPSLDKDLTSKLMKIMEKNPYAAFLRALSNIVDLDHYYISINCSSTLDQRTHNAPTSSEIAAIWIDGDDCSSNGKFERDIRVYTKSGEGYCVSEHYSCYDSLQYPLMFPGGEPGWHPNILKVDGGKKNRGRKHRTVEVEHQSFSDSLNQNACSTDEFASEDGPKVTARQYYCYKLQMRPGDPSHQLSFGRLYQQYVVDMYVKIETMRLLYIRNNQARIRVDFYQGIVDSISMGFQQGKDIGKRILLPPSFIGGPRDMRRRYIDAMALVRRFGKPDIFLTMTCNSNWEEIKSCVEQYEETQNRPDLVTRVFRAKVEIMKKRLLVDRVFGDIASLVYVIEFQKRGPPHAHFLIILQPGSKPYTPEDYDRLVSAELPNQEEDPVLYQTVVSHMFHGPCGALNPKNVCMKNGSCKNKYPKPFCNHTIHGEQTYPQYRRRDNGSGARIRIRGQSDKVYLDNRWVVPHNPQLLKEFDCHMNVEICCDIRAVKYLYKYVYKGIDKVSMAIVSEADENIQDEITTFQSARWISPPEAVWRIYGFTLSYMQPAVMTLQIHLPDFHSVRFAENDNLEEIIQASNITATMLTEFFKMNRINQVASRLKCYYKDFPEYFVWNNGKKQWTERKRGKIIGRIASVNPSEGERYYLRLLLLNVQAPTSYNDLLTVNGKQCSTYRESANLRGLLTTDTTFESAIEEAAAYQLPYSLRVLFATILSYCQLSDPIALYRKFYTDLSEDIQQNEYGEPLSETEIEERVLQDLDKTLETLGKSINDYKLGNIEIRRDPREKLTREIQAEYSIPITPEDLASIDLLNKDQKAAYDKIMDSVLSGTPALYFIDGPGGTGKTFLYKALLARTRSLNHVAIATASSGIAATLLPGGRTAHSRFKLPLEGEDSMDTKISKNSGAGYIISQAKLIVWDEAPMMHRNGIEKVNTIVHDLCRSEYLFGGKVVVFGGDFRQTLPIVEGGTRVETIEASLIKSDLWKEFTICKLTENIRAKYDPNFTNFLMRVGDGTEPATACGKIHIPHQMLIFDTDEDKAVQQLIKQVYPDFSLFESNPEAMCSRAILAPKNDAVDELNEALLENFPGQMHSYTSIDRALNNHDEAHYSDFLNLLHPSGMPKYELCLKLNCPVVLLRNINPLIGFANGTRLVCKSLDAHVIGVEIVAGQFKGTHGFIPRITHHTKEGQKYVIPFSRQQFPLRLAFAMTINKAQGQTLDFVGIYLRQPVFSHGQLYVALSRARKAENVKVLLGSCATDKSPTDLTLNEVYQEVLQLAAIQ